MRNKGFTLLEVMISLFILAIIGALIARGLTTVLNTQEHIKNQSRQLFALQLSLLIIERDIDQIINRPIKDMAMTKPAVMVTNHSLEFTRTGFFNPFSLTKRSTLQRVAYQLEGTNLIRLTWDTLDRDNNTKPITAVLLTQVKSLKIEMLPANNFLTTTQPLNLADPNANNLTKMAIVFTLELENMGQIKRIFPLAINVSDKKDIVPNANTPTTAPTNQKT